MATLSPSEIQAAIFWKSFLKSATFAVFMVFLDTTFRNPIKSKSGVVGLSTQLTDPGVQTVIGCATDHKRALSFHIRFLRARSPVMNGYAVLLLAYPL
jgi:hypothetical protein